MWEVEEFRIHKGEKNYHIFIELRKENEDTSILKLNRSFSNPNSLKVIDIAYQYIKDYIENYELDIRTISKSKEAV